ncbi:MAG: hypothetical protein ACLRP3_20460 [Escherichia sp.]
MQLAQQFGITPSSTDALNTFPLARRENPAVSGADVGPDLLILDEPFDGLDVASSAAATIASLHQSVLLWYWCSIASMRSGICQLLACWRIAR